MVEEAYRFLSAGYVTEEVRETITPQTVSEMALINKTDKGSALFPPPWSSEFSVIAMHTVTYHTETLRTPIGYRGNLWVCRAPGTSSFLPSTTVIRYKLRYILLGVCRRPCNYNGYLCFVSQCYSGISSDNSTEISDRSVGHHHAIPLFDATMIGNITAAGCTIVFWDYLITLQQEKEFIWKRPFTKSKLVFLYVRYSVFIAQITTYYGE